jgi:hypothetical protein
LMSIPSVDTGAEWEAAGGGVVSWDWP